jgi:glycosyltransferase involved in cell wall biosynthesis
MARRVPAAVSAIGPQIVRQLPIALRERARVVYNAVDPAKFVVREEADQTRAELGIERRDIVIGNAARLTPWKGQHHLLDAFARVAAAVPNAKLLLVGGSLFGDAEYQSRLRRRADQPDLKGRVVFAGHRQDMRAMFSIMDVFAYCSVEKDICPLSLLEAMSAGLPLAVFDIEGAREAIADQQEGLLVPTGDASALAAALLRLIESRELRQRLGASARDRVERQFSIGQHVVRMQEVFEEVLRTA